MRIDKKKSRFNVQTVTLNIELCSRIKIKSVIQVWMASSNDGKANEITSIYTTTGCVSIFLARLSLSLTRSFIRWALDSYIRHTLCLRWATYHYICITSFKRTHKRSRTDTPPTQHTSSRFCLFLGSFSFIVPVSQAFRTHICINGFTIYCWQYIVMLARMRQCGAKGKMMPKTS